MCVYIYLFILILDNSVRSETRKLCSTGQFFGHRGIKWGMVGETKELLLTEENLFVLVLSASYFLLLLVLYGIFRCLLKIVKCHY